MSYNGEKKVIFKILINNNIIQIVKLFLNVI